MWGCGALFASILVLLRNNYDLREQYFRHTFARAPNIFGSAARAAFRLDFL
jgi:hypothetical protein